MGTCGRRSRTDTLRRASGLRVGHMNNTTSPNLSQLTGTVFGVDFARTQPCISTTFSGSPSKNAAPVAKNALAAQIELCRTALQPEPSTERTRGDTS